jgi:hypothetical protein
VGLLGAILVCFGPAALLGLLADGSLASALVAGLHGGLGALFVGLADQRGDFDEHGLSAAQSERSQHEPEK